MSKWHDLYEDTVVFGGNEDDPRSGIYFVYNADTIDYLLNNMDWVRSNDAFDERDYVLDTLDMYLESNDGELIFIPSEMVVTKIKTYYEMRDQDFIERYLL